MAEVVWEGAPARSCGRERLGSSRRAASAARPPAEAGSSPLGAGCCFALTPQPGQKTVSGRKGVSRPFQGTEEVTNKVDLSPLGCAWDHEVLSLALGTRAVCWECSLTKEQECGHPATAAAGAPAPRFTQFQSLPSTADYCVILHPACPVGDVHPCSATGKTNKERAALSSGQVPHDAILPVPTTAPGFGSSLSLTPPRPQPRPPPTRDRAAARAPAAAAAAAPRWSRKRSKRPSLRQCANRLYL